MKKITLLATLIAISLMLCAQSNSVELTKYKKSFKNRKTQNTFSNKGFRLYRNYFYILVFKDKKEVFGKIISVENDTLFITNSFNEITSKENNQKFDTLKYSIRDMSTLKLITEDLNGPYRSIDLLKFKITTSKNVDCLEIPLKTEIQKGSFVDCYPFLTNNGIAFLYEKDGILKMTALKLNK